MPPLLSFFDIIWNTRTFDSFFFFFFSLGRTDPDPIITKLKSKIHLFINLEFDIHLGI